MSDKISTKAVEMTSDRKNPYFKPGKSVSFFKFIVDAAWYLSFVPFVLVPLVLIGFAIFDSSPSDVNVTLPISINWEYGNQDLEDIGFFVKKTEGATTIQVKNAPIWLFLLPLVLMAGLMWVIHQLRLIFRTIHAGNPFDEHNPKRIQNIGYAIMASGPVVGIISSIVGMIYIKNLIIPGG